MYIHKYIYVYIHLYVYSYDFQKICLNTVHTENEQKGGIIDYTVRIGYSLLCL
jgi:hypothetical protein